MTRAPARSHSGPIGNEAGDDAARVEQAEGERGDIQPGQHAARFGDEPTVHAQVGRHNMQGGHIAVANVLIQRAPDDGAPGNNHLDK